MKKTIAGLYRFVLACSLLMVTNFIQAQKQLLHSIYFEIGKKEISNDEKSIIKVKLEQLHCTPFNIELHSFADSTGNAESNFQLSKERASNVKDVLTSFKLCDGSTIDIKAFGETETAVFAKKYVTLGEYRRVDILVSCAVEPLIDSTAPDELVEDDDSNAQDIRELYAQLSPEKEIFTIDPTIDNTIRCKHKTVIYIPANTLTIDNQLAKDEIAISVLVCRTTAEMIAANLTTQTTNNRTLRTLGMVYIDAFDSKGNRAEIIGNGAIDIAMPTNEDTSEAQLFEGESAERGNVKWLPQGSDLIIYPMGSLIATKNIDVPGRCNTFWCRFWKNLFPDKSITKKDGVSRGITFTSEGYSAVLLNSIKQMELDSLYKKYDVKDYWSLQKKMKDERIEKLESGYLNADIPMEDVNFYIMNVARFGWANCDVFSRMGNGPKEEIYVLEQPSKSVDCKIIYKKENIILPLISNSGKYEIQNIPVGVRLSIIVFKYENNEAYAYIDEVTMQKNGLEVKPEYKKYSMLELKEALLQLN
ncbi:MAG: OmpA family protein [Flavobacteriales bacterium]